LKTIILVSLLLIFYIYIGYPLLLFLISLFKKHKVNTSDDYLPSVSIIIAAYNEEKVIENKIKNTLDIDYPVEKLEIIVFSDSSNDNTDEIVKKYEEKGVKLLRIEGRKGKTYCQNRAVEKARGKIIVFSDANSMYQKDAIKKLMRNFTDEQVGCVSGELKYISGNDKKSDNSSEGIYWKYEKTLKRLESKISSLVGANGAIYAVRKKIYVNLSDFAISDFAEPFLLFLKGFRTVYEPEAIANEKNDDTFRESYQRRVRIVTRTFSSIIKDKQLASTLNVFRFGIFSLQFISHKLLRWFSGLFLIFLIIANLLLYKQGIFYQIMLWGQVLFYFLALLGLLAERFPRVKDVKIAPVIFYFCLSCWAMLVGVKNALLNKEMKTWETIRQ
jgi:cellulose synthase/poly-beta-1,6-N-acetylglucosamine synthase-like glycosyltransferase